MVKFGKEFKKLKIEAWKDKYINYKTLKQIIKKSQALKTQNFLNVDERSKLALQKDFTSVLDKELKRMYLFFVKNERDLYLGINTHVHSRRKYPKMTHAEIFGEIVKLEVLCLKTLDLTKFIIDNMTALKKILKKFDKNYGRLLGPISYDYISSKLATKSDLLYIFRFKIVDEVSAILNDLIEELKTHIAQSQAKVHNEDSEKEKELLKSGLLVSEEVSVDNKKESSDKEGDNRFKEISSDIAKSLRRIDELISKFKIYFKHWSKFLKVSSKKKGNSEVFLEQEKEEEAHERRETINMNISTVASYDFFEIIIPSTENVMTKANKINIFITFAYTTIVCLCYTAILPNIGGVPFQKDSTTGLVMAMTPFGCIISLSYEIIWIKHSFKRPFLLSCFFLILGNFLYFLSFILKSIPSMIFGRFCIGLGTGRNSNRTYLLNYVPKSSIKRVLFRYKLLIMVASCVGPLLVVPFAFTDVQVEVSEFKFDQFSIPTFICLLLSFITFFVIVVLYRDPYSLDFIPYSNYDEGDNTRNQDGEPNFNNRNTVNDINDKIQEVNVKQSYNDSNQVAITIDRLMLNEVTKRGYVFKAFVAILILTFIINFSSDFTLVFASIFLNDAPDYSNYSSVIFTGVFFLVLVFRLFNWKVLSTKISDNNSLLLFLLIIPFTCFIIYLPKYTAIYFVVVFAIISIDTQLLFDTVQHLFIRIIPYDYSLKKLLALNYVKFMAEFAKTLGCFIIMIRDVVEVEEMTQIVFGVILALFALLSITVIVLKHDLREKSICRILRARATRKFNSIEF